jgi:hypothetical protein
MWQIRLLCPKCGYHISSPTYNVNHDVIIYPCCKRCGEPVSENRGWRTVTMRRVWRPKWFNPFAVEWEIKEEK